MTVNSLSLIRPRGLAIFLILLCWLGLALFYATGPVGSDDYIYLEIARHPTPPSDPILITQGYARFGIWGPLKLADAIWPGTWFTFVIVPLISALAALALTGWVAWRWMGVGPIVAIVSLGLVPYFVVFSTIMLPDTMGACLLSLGLLLVGPPLLERDAKRAFGRCLLGGMVVGLSFAAKETVILLCPAIALFVLVYRRRQGWAWQRLSVIAIGTAAGLGVEMAVLWAISGDPLFHFHSMRIAYEQYGSDLADHHLWTIAYAATDYLRWMYDPLGTFGGWGILYLLAMVYASVRSTDWTRLLMCCALVMGTYISVGSIDLTRYYPIHHQPRYLITLLPIGALLTAHMVHTLWYQNPNLRPAVSTIAVILIAASLLQPNKSAGRTYFAPTLAAARLALADDALFGHDETRIVGSAQSVFRLAPLIRSSHRQPLTTTPEPHPTTAADWSRRHPGSYVLVTRADRSQKCQQEGGALSVESRRALDEFDRVRSVAPPRTRIESILSRFGIIKPTRDEPSRIDVYYIPDRPRVASHRAS